ncbi:MAG: T9SS type A sorting domain-containing protein, partial [Muribaculaceae bacterium]|nr:T9SS type A sorting domain-containing protein [Muribaculaceae bacterium]
DNINEPESRFYFYNDVLTVNGKKTIDHIEIYSIYGACIKYTPISSVEASVYCNDLPKGLYIAQACYSDGSKSVNKFMK